MSIEFPNQVTSCLSLIHKCTHVLFNNNYCQNDRKSQGIDGEEIWELWNGIRGDKERLICSWLDMKLVAHHEAYSKESIVILHVDMQQFIDLHV